MGSMLATAVAVPSKPVLPRGHRALADLLEASSEAEIPHVQGPASQDKPLQIRSDMAAPAQGIAIAKSIP